MFVTFIFCSNLMTTNGFPSLSENLFEVLLLVLTCVSTVMQRMLQAMKGNSGLL